MRMRISALFLALSCLTPLALSDSRLAVPTKINGRPARLDIDTGSERTCLFDAGARRLGLQVTPPDPSVKIGPGRVAASRTEECTLEIGGMSARVRLSVVSLPSYLKPGTDGVIGWDLLADKLVEMNGPAGRFLIHDERTFDVSQWQCWPIRPNAKVLIAQIPAPPMQPGYAMATSCCESTIWTLRPSGPIRTSCR